MNVEISLDTSEEDARALSDGIVAFNLGSIPSLEPNEQEVRFHVLAKDHTGSVVGGLRGACYWNTLHIELLWLSDAVRGTGIGREIIGKAEGFAQQNGCENALVETTSWQAKPFYEKNGYKLMATLEGRPRGHASHYLTKTLRRTMD